MVCSSCILAGSWGLEQAGPSSGTNMRWVKLVGSGHLLGPSQCGGSLRSESAGGTVGLQWMHAVWFLIAVIDFPGAFMFQTSLKFTSDSRP